MINIESLIENIILNYDDNDSIIIDYCSNVLYKEIFEKYKNQIIVKIPKNYIYIKNLLKDFDELENEYSNNILVINNECVSKDFIFVFVFYKNSVLNKSSEEYFQKWQEFLKTLNININDCILNFFLIHHHDTKEYYDSCLIIYYDEDNVMEETSFNDKINRLDFSKYIKFVEEFTKYNDNVFLEIVDFELAQKDGYGRFFAYVNDKSYIIEYDNDWNSYIDYKKKI